MRAKAFGAIVGAVLWAVLSLALFAVRACGKLFEMLAEKVGKPTLAQALARATPQPAKLALRAGASVPKPLPVADQIYQISFKSGWKVHAFVYLQDKQVKRVLKPATPELEEQMRFRMARTSVELPTIPLEGMKVEAVLEDTEVTASEIIKGLQEKMKGIQRYALGAQRPASTQGSPAVPETQAAAAQPPAVPQSQPPQPAPTAVQPRAAIAEQPEPVARPERPKATPFSSPTLAKIGKAYRGKVLAAGERPSSFGAGRTTYTVSIKTSEEEKDLRGVELRTLFQQQGIKVGDTVEVISLGKKPIQGKDGKVTQNCYEVKLIERGQANSQAAP